MMDHQAKVKTDVFEFFAQNNLEFDRIIPRIDNLQGKVSDCMAIQEMNKKRFDSSEKLMFDMKMN
jgi:hypothetical protein